MKKILTLLFCLSIVNQAFTQGNIMLVGGGGEADGGWSDAPYKWCIQQSKTKRVAVIAATAAGATAFIPDYFKKLGAKEAKNFVIDSKSVADAQATYDSLKTYDCIFIKGGDQALYYTYYKDTKTQKALQEIFNGGGVLSGTSAGAMILSPIVYTAEKGSIYPDEALTNPNDPYMTLKNDFLNVFPKNWIFDTHVSQRGRINRMPCMLANWSVSQNQAAKALGIDDQTAVCIDKKLNAKVYGTGSVSIMENASINPFDLSKIYLQSKALQIRHFLADDTFIVDEGIVLPTVVETKMPEVVCNNIILSGSDLIADNQHVISYFVGKIGLKTDPILVVYPKNIANIADWKITIETAGAKNLTLISDGNTIPDTTIFYTKVIFVSLPYADFQTFMASPRGKGIFNAIKKGKYSPLFIGSSAQWAGSTVCSNVFLNKDASYKGDLVFEKNPNAVLQNTMLMSNTYLPTTSNFYENASTSLFYGMVKDSLRNAVWLSGKSAMLVKLSTIGKEYNISAIPDGSMPAILVTHDFLGGKFAKNPAPSNAKPRNIVSSVAMRWQTLSENQGIYFATLKPTVANNDILETKKINVSPNPSEQYFTFDIGEIKSNILIYNTLGEKIIEINNVSGKQQLDFSAQVKGVYFLQVVNEKMRYEAKIVKE